MANQNVRRECRREILAKYDLSSDEMREILQAFDDGDNELAGIYDMLAKRKITRAEYPSMSNDSNNKLWRTIHGIVGKEKFKYIFGHTLDEAPDLIDPNVCQSAPLL